MQFEALKVFCDIARCRSFSQAAAANRLTQSAASQIVHQLEKRLDVQLINRSTRPLQLTELGQVYYDGCKDLVEQYLALEASILQARPPLTTTVEVAAIYSVGLGDMGLYVERFRAQQPHAEVHVNYLHPKQVYERVLGGTADLGLVSFPRRARALTVLPWREEAMILACAPTHPLAGLPAVRPTDLEGVKYIGFNRELVICREVDRFLRGQRVEVEVEHVFDNIEQIKKGIEEIKGVALLPEPTVRREVRAGTLAARPLAGCRFVRPLGIIHRRQHKPSPAAQGFIDLLRGNGDGSGDEAGPAAPDTDKRARGNGAAHSRRRTPRSSGGDQT
jgi:DNA-binding transcriptional LysR family regulator